MIHEDPPDLLQLQSFLTYRLARVQAKLNAQGMRVLKEAAGIGLTQWRVIAMLGVSGEDPIIAADLQRIVDVDKGLLSRTIRGLAEDGYVVSIPDEDDHRRHQLALTEAGQALYEQTLPVMRRRQAQLRAALTVEEIEVLFTALEKLETAVETEEKT